MHSDGSRTIYMIDPLKPVPCTAHIATLSFRTFGPTEDPAEEDPFEGKTPLSELAVDEPPQEVSDEALRAMVAGDSSFHLRIFDVCRHKRRAFARTVRKEAARVAAMTFNVSAEKWKMLANKIPPRHQTPERQAEIARQVAKLAHYPC